MRITILTIGSRGDVQPYIALGKGLRAAGHDVTLATHQVWAEWIRTAGLRHARLEGGFHRFQETEEGQAWMTHGARPLDFLRTVYPQTVRLLREQLADAVEACAGGGWGAGAPSPPEAIVFTHLAVAGWHLAEKLGIPCCGATLQPVTPTRCFPSAVLGNGRSLGLGALNRLSHVAVDVGYAAAWRGEVNRWRRESLGLGPTPLGFRYSRFGGAELPLICGFSEAVVPRPREWSDRVSVTGYWFLDEAAGFQPPQALAEFLAEGPPPVYVGFGSMVLGDPEATRALVLEALERAGQRGVVAIGGHCGPGLPPPPAAACTTPPATARLSRAALPSEPRLSPTVLAVGSIPHDWLFPRTAAVVHHGGAGTTAVGLRAGVPTVVVPFLADQFFWGERVLTLGVGPAPLPFSRLSADGLAAAICAATGDEGLRSRAAELGARIRREDGVARAVEVLERVLAQRQASGGDGRGPGRESAVRQ